ncbi:hypothetical protein F4859DRAFT_375523 [Xylaria cf. heliscus]|nr:hypothetical protein F4859DRAFT_375523 [Xylaria cf. heliscus]
MDDAAMTFFLPSLFFLVSNLVVMTTFFYDLWHGRIGKRRTCLYILLKPGLSVFLKSASPHFCLCLFFFFFFNSVDKQGVFFAWESSSKKEKRASRSTKRTHGKRSDGLAARWEEGGKEEEEQ